MANRYAVKSGNWSDVTVWDGGVSLPSAGDVVRPNTYTVTIDQDITVASLRQDASSPAASGGTFAVSSGSRTITADILPGAAVTSGMVVMSSTGTLNIVGNVTASTAASSACTAIRATAGTVNITGNCLAAGYSARPIVATNCNVNITGNVTGANSNFASSGVDVSNGALTVVGNVTGGGPNASGLVAITLTTATAFITGNVTGGTGTTTNYGVQLVGSSVATITGTITASTVDCAVYGPSTCVVTIVGTLVSASNGVQPVLGVLTRLGSGTTRYEFRKPNGDAVSFYTGDSIGDLPAAANVRYPLSYGYGSRVGMMKVPVPSAVGINVPVDNTIGTAQYLTAQQVWDFLAANATTVGSMGERMKNAATPQSVGDQVAAAGGA